MGAAGPRSGCGRFPELTDVNSDQQNQGLQASLDDRPDDRLAPRRHAADDRRRRSTTPSASGRSRRSTRRSTSTTSSWRSHPKFWQDPRGAQATSTSARPTGEPGPARRGLRPLRADDDLPDGEPPGAVPVRDPLVQPAHRRRARRRRRRDRAARSARCGLPAAIRGSFQGTAQAFQASLANEPLLILAALLAVYIVLGVLYESLIHPLTILSTLPSAGVGALLALLLFTDRPVRHRAHRDHPAHRHRQEERDPDDRLRDRGRAAGGQGARGRRSSRRACSASARSP